MDVIELCGDKLVKADLPTLLAHYPWLRDFNTTSTEKAIKILKSTSAHLLSTAPFTKSESPIQTNSSSKCTPRQAVEWLTDQCLDEEKIALALIQEDGNEVRGLLRAAGQDPTKSAVDAVSAFLSGAVSKDLEPLLLAMPPLQGDVAAIDLFKEAWAENKVKRTEQGLQVNNKCTWYFEPDGFMRQGSLGAAFWVATKDLSLENYVTECYTLTVGDEIGCLEQQPSSKMSNIVTLSTKTTSVPRVLLLNSLQDGVLHRLCVLDYVMCNGYRTSNTVYLANNGAIKITTGKNVSEKAMLPAYLRMWFSKNWQDMTVTEKVANWPSSGGANSTKINGWLQSLELIHLKVFTSSVGLDLSPCYDRLDRLKKRALEKGLDMALCESWIEITN